MHSICYLHSMKKRHLSVSEYLCREIIMPLSSHGCFKCLSEQKTKKHSLLCVRACVCMFDMFDRQTHASGFCDAAAHRCSKFSKQTGEAREQGRKRRRREEKKQAHRASYFCAQYSMCRCLLNFAFQQWHTHTQKCLLRDTYAHTFSSTSGRCGQGGKQTDNEHLEHLWQLSSSGSSFFHSLAPPQQQLNANFLQFKYNANIAVTKSFNRLVAQIWAMQVHMKTKPLSFNQMEPCSLGSWRINVETSPFIKKKKKILLTLLRMHNRQNTKHSLVVSWDSK